MKIAVFASHNGSVLQSIIDGCNENILCAEVCAVFSNNSQSVALKRARDNNIPAFHFSQKVIPDLEQLENAVLDKLMECETNIIFLAGYMKKLGSSILRAYENNIFNIHPSLLPKYGGKGMYGINVHSAVINAKETETGITIHRVSEEYDEGEIVAQTRVPVLQNDTPESLALRILQQEHVFVVDFLSKFNWKEASAL